VKQFWESTQESFLQFDIKFFFYFIKRWLFFNSFLYVKIFDNSLELVMQIRLSSIRELEA
jgi:hypothetical protein